MLTANPFRVPRMRRLLAELVRRIVEQGKAKITAKHFSNMMPNMASCCMTGSWIRAVNGIAK
jgi:hypothetical protein